MNEQLTPGQVVRVAAGAYKGQAGEVRGFDNDQTGGPAVALRIAGKIRYVKIKNIEVPNGKS